MFETISKNERFLDEGTKIDEFSDEFLVVCPKCESLAKVILAEPDSVKNNIILFAPRKLVCTKCVYRKDWSAHKISAGSNVDWYFQLPLWLEISCCGEKLWAYNEKHLAFLERYVSAKLRERTKKGRNSFLSKLPKWMKTAKNRDEILKAIGKLKEKLNGKY